VVSVCENLRNVRSQLEFIRGEVDLALAFVDEG
jgi:hypothetical protein